MLITLILFFFNNDFNFVAYGNYKKILKLIIPRFTITTFIHAYSTVVCTIYTLHVIYYHYTTCVHCTCTVVVLSQCIVCCPQEVGVPFPPLCAQGMGDLDTAVTYYREVLKYDSTCIEAIACIATHHFYSDQPELALRFYR